MSAYDDIRTAIRTLPIRKPGCERVILVGVSAEQSIRAAIATESAPQWALHQIDHLPVRRAQSGEFRGWTIRDWDPGGYWRDMHGRPGGHPDFERAGGAA